MSRWSRRDLLKTAFAASASAITANTLGRLSTGETASSDGDRLSSASSTVAAPRFAQTANSPRERLLLDFGWRFQFGHANDAAKDFGLGARRRELQFAKSGGFLPVTRTNFDDSGRKRIDLP